MDEHCVSTLRVEQHRFSLVGGSYLTRIAILNMPHYYCGDEEGYKADEFAFRINVVPGCVDLLDNPFIRDSLPRPIGKRGLEIRLGVDDICPWTLLRVALGRPSWERDRYNKRVPSQRPICEDDYAYLAARLDRDLRVAMGVPKPVPRKVQRR